uniref:ribonuclease H n=1 Tax=Naja naja TaxID=35670 RepID=A0A8C6VPS2_NAJNA
VGIIEGVRLELNDIVTETEILFIPESGVNLLGRDLMEVFGIELWDKQREVCMCVLTTVDEETIIPEVWAEEEKVSSMTMQPVQIKVKPGITELWTPQYSLSMKGREGLKPVINRLLKQGLLEPIMSPFNLAVQKKDGTYQLVHDLRRINEIVIPRFSVVPDPYTILGKIPPKAKWFTVTDLKDAFWACPLEEKSRDLFAFEWDDPKSVRKQQLRWTVLPQGYTESPLLFRQALEKKLITFKRKGGMTLIQYVDDLLLTGEKEGEVREASVDLLNWLGDQGLKVSKEKLSWRSGVNYGSNPSTRKRREGKLGSRRGGGKRA